MKTMILTLAGALAFSLIAFGAHVEERKEACRASLVEGKSILVALPLLKVADQKAPLTASLTMAADDLPHLVRAVVRPIYEAHAYCTMAEEQAK